MQENFSLKIESMSNWAPPLDWLKITTIDAHTEGEPLRVIIRGFPEIKGGQVLSQRQFIKENFDHLRTMLMWEPRGHADMYGVILTPPFSPEANFGVIFLHNEGYSTGCGHAVIAVTKVVLETGMFPMKSPVTKIGIDTPSGLVTAYAKIEDNRVKSVAFHNVPSYVVALDETIDVQGLGEIKYDLAFGGAYYALVQAESVGLDIVPDNIGRFIQYGMEIKRVIMKSRPIEHPFEKDLNFLYGTIFIGPPKSECANSRNICIFAEGEVDRCPTGTGISARLAIHYKRGDIDINESMVIESIIDTTMIGKVVKPIKFGNYDAVIPEIEGTAYITGRNELLIDPEDPLKYGFILR